MKDEMGIVGASTRLMFGEIEVLPQLLCCLVLPQLLCCLVLPQLLCCTCHDYCAFSLYSCYLTEICG